MEVLLTQVRGLQFYYDRRRGHEKSSFIIITVKFLTVSFNFTFFLFTHLDINHGISHLHCKLPSPKCSVQIIVTEICELIFVSTIFNGNISYITGKFYFTKYIKMELIFLYFSFLSENFPYSRLFFL